MSTITTSALEETFLREAARVSAMARWAVDLEPATADRFAFAPEIVSALATEAGQVLLSQWYKSFAGSINLLEQFRAALLEGAQASEEELREMTRVCREVLDVLFDHVG